MSTLILRKEFDEFKLVPRQHSMDQLA